MAIHRCNFCEKTSTSSEGIKQHKKAVHSFPCDECDRVLITEEGLQAHWEAVHKYSCNEFPCNGRRFPNSRALADHLTFNERHRCAYKKRNFTCGECGLGFRLKIAYELHLKAYDHAVSFHCVDCDKDFVNQDALDQHLRDKVHKKRKVLTTTTCTICEKEFKAEADLAKHMKSSIHKNLPTAKCPLCDQEYTLISGVTQHWESGNCRSGINKKSIDALIMKYDTTSLITKEKYIPGLEGIERKLITCGSDDGNEENGWVSVSSTGFITPSTSEEGGVFLLTPNSSRRSSFGSQVSGFATPTSQFIPDELERFKIIDEEGDTTFYCPACGKDGRKFASLRALSAHISSVAHAPKLYKCPLPLFINLSKKKGHKAKEFKTLSGLTQHLENEACKGGMEGFKLAVKFLDSKMKELGFTSKWIDM